MEKQLVQKLLVALERLNEITLPDNECFCSEPDGYKCINCSVKGAIKEAQEYLGGSQVLQEQKQLPQVNPDVKVSDEELKDFFND